MMFDVEADCSACGQHFVAPMQGTHRLLCGDGTMPTDVDRVFNGEPADMILVDPPYCSGGFQEAGRASGSIGTDARIKRRIANDTLSTRGYMALMKAVISLAKGPNRLRLYGLADVGQLV